MIVQLLIKRYSMKSQIFKTPQNPTFIVISLKALKFQIGLNIKAKKNKNGLRPNKYDGDHL